MKYLVLLIGEGDTLPWSDHSDEEKAAVMAQFGDFAAACAAREGVELLAGEALSDPGDATVMRTSSAGTVTLTDGPYAEVIEGMGGFYLLERGPGRRHCQDTSTVGWIWMSYGGSSLSSSTTTSRSGASSR